jgi:hypothetical protein
LVILVAILVSYGSFMQDKSRTADYFDDSETAAIQSHKSRAVGLRKNPVQMLLGIWMNWNRRIGLFVVPEVFAWFDALAPRSLTADTGRIHGRILSFFKAL